GLAPWDVLAQGIARQLDIGLGQASIMVSFMVLILALFFKAIPSIGTFLNIIIIGLLIDIFIALFNFYFVVPESFPSLLVIYTIGLILMSLGASLYIVTKFGAGPRDMLLLGIIQKFKVSITYVKPAIEGIVLVIGIYLGGTLGIGTILNLLLMGYFMDIIFRYLNFDPKVVKQYNIIEQYSLIKRYLSY
ncbi:MAG: hypothetical protein LCH30_09325, partial [Proteobacteria bacterium]|nr:hypothetical protein [Pseudomonadota bacterium]